jgi:hypothetical protein
MTTQITPFSLVYGLEVTLPIEFEVESVQVAIDSRLTDSQLLRNMLTTLKELNEKRKMGVQYIETINGKGKSPSTNDTKRVH